jgi:hypothetical protein
MVESIFEERIMGCPGDCAGGDTRANNEVRCAAFPSLLLDFILRQDMNLNEDTR